MSLWRNYQRSRRNIAKDQSFSRQIIIAAFYADKIGDVTRWDVPSINKFHVPDDILGRVEWVNAIGLNADIVSALQNSRLSNLDVTVQNSSPVKTATINPLCTSSQRTVLAMTS